MPDFELLAYTIAFAVVTGSLAFIVLACLHSAATGRR